MTHVTRCFKSVTWADPHPHTHERSDQQARCVSTGVLPSARFDHGLVRAPQQHLNHVAYATEAGHLLMCGKEGRLYDVPWCFEFAAAGQSVWVNVLDDESCWSKRWKLSCREWAYKRLTGIWIEQYYQQVRGMIN